MMAKTLIVKYLDSTDEKIDKFLKESLDSGKSRIYNTLNGTDNEKFANMLKEENEIDIVLFVKVNSENKNEILSINIAKFEEINDGNNIVYSNKICIDRNGFKRTIDGIVDMIDLDLENDFSQNTYLSVNSMEHLNAELKERMYAAENNKIVNDDYCVESDYTKDKEKILCSKAFRRLVDKAQIFGADKGDYLRTRMTHSLEVYRIAKAIASKMELEENLTEAIALGHDLGHTPFGHQGERTLNDILNGKKDVGIYLEGEEKLKKMMCYGGFKHNYQSVRLLTCLEENCFEEGFGLNVSYEVIEGILKHTRLKENIDLKDFVPCSYVNNINIKTKRSGEAEEKQICKNKEGQVVAIADEIAQRGHDIEDALLSRVISIGEFLDGLNTAKCETIRNIIAEKIYEIDKSEKLIVDKNEQKISLIVKTIQEYLIKDIIDNNNADDEKNIGFSPFVEKVNTYLEKIVQKKIICNNEVATADDNANVVIMTLFRKYYRNPRLLHKGTIHRIFIEMLRSENEFVSKSAIDLSNGNIAMINDEIDEITKEALDVEIVSKYINRDSELDEDDFDKQKMIAKYLKRKIIIRAITDYISGMTDGYAMEEFNKLM